MYLAQITTLISCVLSTLFRYFTNSFCGFLFASLDNEAIHIFDDLMTLLKKEFVLNSIYFMKNYIHIYIAYNSE